jgi:Tfp pilus assembly ATPase PilU
MLRMQGGSDLYLVAGLPPSIRVDGTIRPLTEAVLDGDDIESRRLRRAAGLCDRQLPLEGAR